jgi:hypothetical protein
MAIRMVTEVGGEDFEITLSRDDAGNYVAEAAPLPQGGPGTGRMVPRLRVVDSVKERVMRSLFDSLRDAAAKRPTDPSPEGPDAPAVA